MKKKQKEEYEQYLKDKINGYILTPDGLRFICEACNFDAKEIGNQMLFVYAKLKSKGRL